MSEENSNQKKPGKHLLFRAGRLLLIICIVLAIPILFYFFSTYGDYQAVPFALLFVLSVPTLISLFMILIGYLLGKSPETERIEDKKQLVFPLKTKFAAWWLIFLGIINSFAFLPESWSNVGGYDGIYSLGNYAGRILFLTPSLLYSLIGIFILKRKRRVWWIAIISLILSLLLVIGTDNLYILLFYPDFDFIDTYIYGRTIAIFSFAVPFILFILDRKNFFKIAS